MRIRSIFLLLFIICVTIFVSLNWYTLATENTINLGFTTTKGPLGLVMLGLLLITSLVFAAYSLAVQTASLLENRSNTKELKAQRELADKAEASRFTELRNVIEKINTDNQARNKEAQELMVERLGVMQQDLRNAVESNGNSLAAYLGEMDDRYKRTNQNSSANTPTSTASENNSTDTNE